MADGALAQSSALERAKAADLVTLPPDVTGTNCANCRFVSGNTCLNPHVHQHLADGATRMCCIYWDAPGTKRAWQHD